MPRGPVNGKYGGLNATIPLTQIAPRAEFISEL
jgi:hypothetical protein